MVVLGIGVGLFYSSVTTAASPRSTVAARASPAAIVYMFQIAGGSIGLGLATTVFTEAAERGGFENGFQWSFRLLTALAVVALLVTLRSVGRAEDYGQADYEQTTA